MGAEDARVATGPRVPGRRSASSLKEIKKRKPVEALNRSGGNQSEPARILGVTRVTIRKQIREFGIDLRRRVDLSPTGPYEKVKYQDTG